LIHTVKLITNDLIAHNDFDNILIKKFPSLELVTTLKPNIGWFISFCKTKDRFIFGCDRGIAVYDYQFKFINSFKSIKEVIGLVSIDSNTVLALEYSGHIEVANINSASQEFHLKLSNSINITFQIEKTKRENNEYSVAT
jgi:hypothetical protein